MRVGISLLTLVPGISGGSETYARELVRALGQVGRHEYRVFLPTIAADVGAQPDVGADGEIAAARGHRADESFEGVRGQAVIGIQERHELLPFGIARRPRNQWLPVTRYHR